MKLRTSYYHYFDSAIKHVGFNAWLTTWKGSHSDVITRRLIERKEFRKLSFHLIVFLYLNTKIEFNLCPIDGFSIKVDLGNYEIDFKAISIISKMLYEFYHKFADKDDVDPEIISYTEKYLPKKLLKLVTKDLKGCRKRRTARLIPFGF